jgi:RNA polymerase sigma-70 factor (ECF subfamily)
MPIVSGNEPKSSISLLQTSPVGVMTDQSTSFGVIAREQLPWLYSLARRLAADHAEDLVQDCLLRAYKSFPQLRDQQAAPAWFRQILVNCANDHHRKRMRAVDEQPIDDTYETTLFRRIVDEDPLPYSDSVHLDFLHSFTDDHVWAVLDRLDPKYRVPLVLVHMEGIPTADVCRMLGVPQNTVLSWLHRGRRLFETEMWNYAEEHQLLRQQEGVGS